jgi:two-component system chemotaxis response regulator CheB
LHLSRKGIGDFLIHRLQQRTPMPCAIPIDGEPIQEGHIYIAPPNQHLLVTKKGITIGHGPAENRWRPSIDVLFRSAAAAYNGHTIGIILTGLLDDGTSGMGAIKRCGGTCIVQDPNEAEYPDMPLSVLNNIEVDYCVSLIQMGTVLDSITTNTNIEITEIPPDVKAESEIARKVATGPDKVTPLGEHTLYSCPDCGGGLWHVDADNINRYRCHIGHSYSEKDLMIKQADVLESTLWVALRMMEERKRLLVKLEGDSMQRGFARIATGHRTAADELQVHVDKLKELLFSVQETDHT